MDPESGESESKDRRSRVSPVSAKIIAIIHRCGWKKLALVAAAVLVGIILIAVFAGESSQHRESVIRKKLLDGGFTTEFILSNEHSPQAKAMKWISEEDTYKISSKDPNVLQRFAMAVVYYAMSTDDPMEAPTPWKNQDNWLSGEGICAWYGVECSSSSDDNGPVISLNLTNNELRGTVPTELTALSQLHKLDLSSNEIDGTIPKPLFSMTSLLDLWLRNNYIGGTIPSTFGAFSSLRQLHLGQNRLVGSIPKEIEHMVNLKDLALDNNQLTGTIPSLRDMEKLTVLYLDHNHLYGKLPSTINKLTNLKEFRLSSNGITGTLTPTFADLKNLGEYCPFVARVASML
jgi:hypothetical protein